MAPKVPTVPGALGLFPKYPPGRKKDNPLLRHACQIAAQLQKSQENFVSTSTGNLCYSHAMCAIKTEDKKDQSQKTQKALHKMATLLAKKNYSEKELKEKLQRDFDPSTIEWALNYGRDQKWILPPKTHAQRVVHQLLIKKKGLHYICQYLRRKGLPQVEISQSLQKENAKDLVERKYGDIKNLSYEAKRKAHGMLKNRGYEDSTIRTVIYEN